MNFDYMMLNMTCITFLQYCDTANIKKYKDPYYIFWDKEYRYLLDNFQWSFNKFGKANKEAVSHFNIINNLNNTNSYFNAKQILLVILREYITRNNIKVTEDEINVILYKNLWY